MSDLTQLSQLKAALSGAQTGAQPVDDEAEIGAHGAVMAEPKIDKLGRSYATGKRKDAVARVWIKRGTGKFLINGREAPVYFARPVLRMLLAQPFASPIGSASSTSGARSPAAACRARPVPFVTASPRR